jgi:hypothetical protein
MVQAAVSRCLAHEYRAAPWPCSPQCRLAVTDGS